MDRDVKWNGLPIVIYGSKGTSKETYNIIKQINYGSNFDIYDFQGFIEVEKSKVGSDVIDGYKIVTCDSDFEEFAQAFEKLGVVIPLGVPQIKRKIYKKIKNHKNLVYPNIIHPSVVFNSDFITLGYGNILTLGVILTCDIRIGNFNLINPNVTVGHDTRIGNFNVINPLSSISGNVKIMDNCLVGTGAKILQELTINSNSIVGAGAVVTKSVDQNTTVVGIPARLIKESRDANEK